MSGRPTPTSVLGEPLITALALVHVPRFGRGWSVAALEGNAPTASVLTLTACHPRCSVRLRYVVHADLVSTTLRDAGHRGAR